MGKKTFQIIMIYLLYFGGIVFWMVVLGIMGYISWEMFSNRFFVKCPCNIKETFRGKPCDNSCQKIADAKKNGVPRSKIEEMRMNRY